jgi:predicted dehydrogenase
MRGLLVGYGSIGRRHLANLHAAGVSDWVVVHTGQGTLPVEPPCPIRIRSDLSEALGESPAFAVIANPTSMHVATALACVEAGCDLLLEKPVSHTLVGLDELAATAAARDVMVLMGFQFRFNPALLRIRDLLRSGIVGAPLYARVIWAEHLPSWHPWEDWRTGYAARADLGGGVHHTICHPLDYLRMLFGDPDSLTASLTFDGPLSLPVAEAADVVLRYPGALSAQIHLDYWCRPPMHRMDLICSDGKIEWDYMAGSLEAWKADGEVLEAGATPGVNERDGLFISEAQHFLEVVARRQGPVCTLADGIAVARICEAIDRSAASGRMVSLDQPSAPPMSPADAGGEGIGPR